MPWRVFLGDLITPVRPVSIVLGIGGMLVIFGIEHGLALANNRGELTGGFCWAFASLMMLVDKESPVDCALWFLLWNGIAAIGVTLLFFDQTGATMPAMGVFTSVLSWMISIALLLIISAGFMVIYRPTQLNPGVAGNLFMVEIGVGTITATILTDEAFGARELTGALRITSAAVIEPLRDLLQHRCGRFKAT